MNRAYVLITPARNEEAFIEKTIRSVVAQTILPQKWVIVSDGSTDRTNEIVDDYASKFDFIELVNLNGSANRSFASKVEAFETGVQLVNKLEFGFLGNLDGDLSFDEVYYENVLTKFESHPKLGIAGGVRLSETQGMWVPEFSSPWSVCAGVQLFRRQCYKEIGGYRPVERMEDAVVEVMARMRGWEVKAFEEIKIFHHRQMGSSMGGTLREFFKYGEAEHSVGYHPLYTLAKFFYRLKEKPFLLGSLFRLSGYVWSVIRNRPLVLSEDVIRFLRDEQRRRLGGFIKGEQAF